MTDVVTVQNEATGPHLVKFCIDAIGHRGFTASAKSREPDDSSARTLNRLIVPSDKCFIRHRFGGERN